MPEKSQTALTVALESESLQALYSAWLELRLARAQAVAGLAREREQLTVKAEYLLKAVEAARGLGPETAQPEKSKSSKRRGKSAPKKKSKLPAPQDELAGFHARAQAEVAAQRTTLEARAKAETREFAQTDARVRAALLARADQHLAIHRPKIELTVHPVGSAQVILELAAPGDEDAVLLLRLLHGRLPSRWGFFSDDAVDDLARGPAHFYPDENVAELHPETADAEDAILFGEGEFVAARMQIPFALPRRAFPRFRLVHHGPISQIEARRKGEPYAHVFRREDGELLTGYLLRLELAKKIALQLHVS